MNFKKIYMSGATTPQSDRDFVKLYVSDTDYSILCIRQNMFRKEVDRYDVYYRNRVIGYYNNLADAKTHIENLCGCKNTYDKVYIQDLVNRTKRAIKKNDIINARKYYQMLIAEQLNPQVKNMYVSQFTNNEIQQLI
jgi:hypothetical protein